MQKSRKSFASNMSADVFLVLALGVFALNLYSQEIAFLPQIVLILVAIFRFDIKYLPSILVLLLDKSFFWSMGSWPMFKPNLGVPLSVANVWLISLCLLSVCKFFTDGFSQKVRWMIPFWLISLVFSALITFRALGLVPFYLAPFAGAMVFAYYFYGYLLCDSWDAGWRYTMLRLMAIGIVLVWGIFFRIGFCRFLFFYVVFLPAFGIYFSIKGRGAWEKTMGTMGLFTVSVYVLFARYVTGGTSFSEDSGGVELGATFTLLASALLAMGLVLGQISGYVRNLFARTVPCLLFAGCVLLVWYAVNKSQNLGSAQNDVTNWSEVQSFADRFYGKLFLDRGVVWREGWLDATTPPYIIRHQENQLVPDEKGYGVVMKVLPHNQLLFLLVVNGWLAGSLLFFLLCVAAFRSFLLFRFPISLPIVFLPAVCFPLFFVNGLTGQSMLVPLGDSWGILLLAGLSYGYYEKLTCRRYR